jgi:hypothetical protein
VLTIVFTTSAGATTFATKIKEATDATLASITALQDLHCSIVPDPAEIPWDKKCKTLGGCSGDDQWIQQ